MAHALAELRYGIVAHQYESGFKCGYISAQTLYEELLWCKGDVLEATVGTSRRIVGAHRRGAGRDLEKKGEK